MGDFGGRVIDKPQKERDGSGTIKGTPGQEASNAPSPRFLVTSLPPNIIDEN